MSTKRGDQPAGPVSLPGWGDNGASGMTIREAFAIEFAKAHRTRCDGIALPPRIMAALSLMDADALLAALAEEPKP